MKYLEKLEHQNKVNPGHKTKYTQKLRPRSTVFEMKVSYKRSRNKKECMEAIKDVY